ncbi:MAG: MotE family protein [Mesorhizobium sp.]|nr:MotE family protein [Mesorhizobium sp.]MBL8578417.1 MotE family protein [Mesorhizobium sp.]
MAFLRFRLSRQMFCPLAAASLALVLSTGIGATQALVEQVEEPGLLAPEEPFVDEAVTGTVRAKPLESGTDVERFCSNIADAARDRRYALQKDELQALQQEIDKRIAALEEKRIEYETWLKRREEFLARAKDDVVKIYSGMRPDAAAERLAEMDAVLAASILMQIEPRKAGVILNEMERKAAAMLTGVMAAASRRTDPS